MCLMGLCLPGKGQFSVLVGSCFKLTWHVLVTPKHFSRKINYYMLQVQNSCFVIVAAIYISYFHGLFSCCLKLDCVQLMC